MPIKELRKYFGYFLIFVSLHEIYSLKKEYRNNKKTNNKNINKIQEEKIMMKFMKGVMLGTIVSAGAIWMYGEATNKGKKKMMKKGKKFLKDMGM